MADVYSNPEKHVTLHNNVKMPILGLGTSHNGGYNHDAVVCALKECGYRHIDTAKRYGCEEYIAQAVKESNIDRAELFLASKCWPTDYGKDKTIIAAKGSCERLHTDYLDLYLLHWPEVPTGYNRKELLAESWRALEVLYDAEIIRAIGVSNFLEPHLESLLEDCSVVPHINQCEFHPFNNPISLREMCAQNNIQFEGYSPLAKGRILSSNFLTDICREIGKTPSQVLIRWSLQNRIPTIPKSTKPERVINNAQGYSPLANGTIFSDMLIQSVAKKCSKSCSQVVLRWNVQNKVVCIPKSTREERIKQNSEVFDFNLSPEAMTLLNSKNCNLHVAWDPHLIFDFELSSEQMAILNSMPQCLTVMDRSTIQEKIDNPKPDGYKLTFVKVPPIQISC